MATVLAATAVAFAMVIPAASAQTTTIRAGGPTAAAYSGNVQASLLGTATVSSSLGSGSCNESTLTGSIQSDGSGLTINAASFSNDGGPCTGSTTATLTPENLPWTGGSVSHDAAGTGGRDAAVTIANFRVRAVINLLGGITCIFGGSLTANGYNGDNPNRPVTTNDQAQVGVSNATVNVQPGSFFLCPSTAQVTATYQLQGETVAGSGVYDQALYVTE